MRNKLKRILFLHFLYWFVGIYFVILLKRTFHSILKRLSENNTKAFRIILSDSEEKWDSLRTVS